MEKTTTTTVAVMIVTFLVCVRSSIRIFLCEEMEAHIKIIIANDSAVYLSALPRLLIFPQLYYYFCNDEGMEIGRDDGRKEGKNGF